MKKSILFIDDDMEEMQSFRVALGEAVSDCNYSYSKEADQAIEILKDSRPEFIFIKHDMPELNSLQFLSIIKNDLQLQHSRVFLYSPAINEETRKMARVLGAAGCIEKTNAASEPTAESDGSFQRVLRANFF